jgi:paraquat-inducible protein B
MSIKASKTLIGGFVVGAVALAVAAVLILGSGRFLQKNHPFVLYFDGSVAGLNVGAPVVMKGVRVGSVTAMGIQFYPQDMAFRTKVTVEIHGAIDVVGEPFGPSRPDGKISEESGPELMQRLVDRGLRARLKLQSVVTGQLMVELDLFPDQTVNRKLAVDKEVELPTVPSSLERLSQTIDQIPFAEIAKDLRETVANLNRLVGSNEVKEILGSMTNAAKNLDALSRDLSTRLGPFSGKLEVMVDDLGKLVRKLDGRVEPLAGSLEETVRSARATLEEARETLAGMGAAFGDDSPLLYELTRTLKATSDAMDSLRGLASLLEQHPEAVLRGKE